MKFFQQGILMTFLELFKASRKIIEINLIIILFVLGNLW